MPPTGSALRSAPTQRTAGPHPDRARSARSVDSVLRALPSHGWPAGWVGRRDRALLVLSQRAALPFTAIAALTVDDIVVHDGQSTIRVDGGDPVVLSMTDDCLLCGPCALSRWLHALGLARVYSDGRVVASVIARAAPLTSHSPHVCEGAAQESEGTGGTLAFPADDRWAPAPANRPALPAPARPLHDLRVRTTRGPHRSVTATRSYAEVTQVDGMPALPSPSDRPAALESRVRALLTDVG